MPREKREQKTEDFIGCFGQVAEFAASLKKARIHTTGYLR